MRGWGVVRLDRQDLLGDDCGKKRRRRCWWGI